MYKYLVSLTLHENNVKNISCLVRKIVTASSPINAVYDLLNILNVERLANEQLPYTNNSIDFVEIEKIN